MRLILALCCLALPAAAQDVRFVVSPSGNIHCALFEGEGGGARCDLVEYEASFPEAPEDCDLDWGFAFAVEGQGIAEPVCAGDSIVTEDAEVLGYGQSVTAAGVTCLSERSGVTCTNLDGHGFTLARARQSLF